MEELLYLTELFDIYGTLLTKRQQRCMELHLFQDFSLAEIGEELGISRQAVHDNLRRSQKTMEEWESKLGMVERYRRERAELSAVRELILKLRRDDNKILVDDVLERLSLFLGNGREV